MAATVAGTVTPKFNASSANAPADLPANVVAGDVIVCHLHSNNGASAITDLQGFTLHQSSNIASAGKGYVLSKIATAADATASGASGSVSYWTFVLSGTASSSVTTTMRVSGAAGSGTAGVEASSGVSKTAATSQAIPEVTTLGTNRLLIWFLDTNQTITTAWPTPPSDANELYDTSSGRSVAGAQEQVAATGATGTRTVTVSASQPVNVYGIAIAASGDTTPPAAPTGLTAVKSAA